MVLPTDGGGMNGVDRPRVSGAGLTVRLVAVVPGALVCAAVLAASAAAVPSAYVPVGDEAAAGVAQYSIAADGTLTAKSPALIGPANDLGDVALSPDGLSAYVSLSFSNPGLGPTTPEREVLQFDVDPGTGSLSPKADPSVRSGRAPSAVVAAPDGRSVYVVDALDDTISQYDVGSETGELSEKSPPAVGAPAGPSDVAVSPDGRSAYVSGFGDNALGQFDIDPATGGLSPKAPPLVENVSAPLGLAMSPDGRSLYAASADGVAQFDVSPADGTLTPKSPAVVAIDIPDVIAVSADGRSAYANTRNDIAQFDIDPSNGNLTAKVPATVPVATNPAITGIGLTPDGGSAFVVGQGIETIFGFAIGQGGRLEPRAPFTTSAPAPANALAISPDAPVAELSAGTEGLLARLDARASWNPGGTIARYDWDFGDGVTLPDGGPTPVHAYARPGTYTVTLTVTSATGCTAGSLVSAGTAVACSGRRGRVSVPVAVAEPPPSPAPPPPSSGDPVCNAVPDRTPGPKGTPAYTQAGLRTQQNIDSAGLRRLNAINAWIDGGIVPTDLCAGAFGPGAFQAGMRFVGGAPHAATPPIPRSVEMARKSSRRGQITKSPRQLEINEAIGRAFFARAEATLERIGALTGGNLAPGANLAGRVVWPGLATSGPQPAPINGTPTPLSIGPLPRKLQIRPNDATVRAQQRRSQRAMMLANRSFDTITRGLLPENFTPGSIGSGRIS